MAPKIILQEAIQEAVEADPVYALCNETDKLQFRAAFTEGAIWMLNYIIKMQENR